MSSRLIISKLQIEESLNELHAARKRSSEGYAQLFGIKDNDRLIVKKVFVPDYESGPFYFQVTNLGRDQIFELMDEEDLILVGQIHSHPEEAYHSEADNRMAMVTLLGGISIVLPNFAKGVSTSNFKEAAKTYRYKGGDSWSEISNSNLEVTNE